MKRKKIGLLLIGFGVICIAMSLCMLGDRQETEGKRKIEPDTITEDGVEEVMQDTEERDTSVATVTTVIELERDRPVQEINSDMYEWPHGNSRYANRREPDVVVYLAQRKEWFDELVRTFQKYEGRDISGLVGWDEEEQMAYYDHFLCEDVVPIYDKYEKFFREGIISLFHVDGDNISFQSAQDDHEYLYYYYDENRNKKTDEFLRGNHIVHVAPHWWWQEPTDPH